ncbi:MAG: hypothetical protein UH542_05935, partial [Bacteroidales bacterium]|nr:hypothetical protein [Bacteroidales bacterium]
EEFQTASERFQTAFEKIQTAFAENRTAFWDSESSKNEKNSPKHVLKFSKEKIELFLTFRQIPRANFRSRKKHK